MSGVIPPLPNMPSWHGAKVTKAQGQPYLLPLPFTAKGAVLYDMKLHTIFYT
jgi:hypothetical protein